VLHRYLRWLVGLVDSDTLPLNVSREMLQAHSSLKTIKKKLVRTLLFLQIATCIRGLTVTSVHLNRLVLSDGALLLQVRKALDMIRKIADAQTAAEAEEKDEDGDKKGALAGT
jgi:Hsp90 protein